MVVTTGEPSRKETADRLFFLLVNLEIGGKYNTKNENLDKFSLHTITEQCFTMDENLILPLRCSSFFFSLFFSSLHIIPQLMMNLERSALLPPRHPPSPRGQSMVVMLEGRASLCYAYFFFFSLHVQGSFLFHVSLQINQRVHSCKFHTPTILFRKTAC